MKIKWFIILVLIAVSFSGNPYLVKADNSEKLFENSKVTTKALSGQDEEDNLTEDGLTEDEPIEDEFLEDDLSDEDLSDEDLSDDDLLEDEIDIDDMIIENFKVTASSISKAKLSWSAIPDADAYEIYQSTNSKNNFKYVDIISDSEYVVSEITPGSTYYFKIRPVLFREDIDLTGEFSKIVSIKTQLLAPKNLKVNSKTYNSISVSWGKAAGAAGYEVYTAASEYGKYTKVKTTSSPSFKHNQLTTNTAYYYKVRAYVKVNGKYRYSSYSAIISGKPVLNPVSSLKTKGSKTNITISWSTSAGAAKYKIYRSSSKNGKYSLLKTTKNKSYIDKSVKKRKIYYYKVTAIRVVNGKEFKSSQSKQVSGITRAAMKPSFTVYTSSTTRSNTSVVLFYLQNYGSLPIRILSSGKLIDDDFYYYDRTLQLVDRQTGEDASWVQLGGYGGDYIAYRVSGRSTWYDSSTTIRFVFMYDGIKYRGYVSDYYGARYEKY